jgi:ATP-dependent DNA helicase RecQ
VNDPLTDLKSSLRDGKPQTKASTLSLPTKPDFQYAVTRFLNSWAHAGKFGADQAILLRQALRRLQTPVTVNANPPDDPDFIGFLEKAGIEWSHAGTLRANPFAPAWLDESPRCDDPPLARDLDESFLAEAYLLSVGYGKWRSPAQKEAAWFTLCAPVGSTRVVVLPTGSGKSLCFQLLARFSPGLTVVVVPTIALAIDQQSNSERLFASYPDVKPVYYAADDDPEITLDAVKQQRTRLLFTSPEACVCGRLRPLLDKFAESGWLTNLVVDEAHLIETWGSHFRVEFQLLASAKRAWRERSGGKLRTFLFSATMTKRCRELLTEMFSKETEPAEFVCQRLRPEIRYYTQSFKTRNDRDQAVIEAIWRLPRPAILYVTEKAEAEAFLSKFRSQGLSRIASFHGDTNRNDRREILRRWKNHEIDLVVATSAFGVGVDKSDVRAVVHACYPENLDRYYQEVGRGGRDGWSSVSLLLTCLEDRNVAEGITVKLAKPEMIQKRWTSMMLNAERIDHLQYALPVGARRTGLLGTRTYEENIRWNKRLLLQLHRARLLELLDMAFRQPPAQNDDPEEWAIVKLAFTPDSPNLSELIETQRNEEAAHFRAGLDNLDELLAGSSCSGRVIAKLYGIASDQRACPGCPRCRRDHREPLDCESLAFPDVQSLVMKRSSVWVENAPTYIGSANRAFFVDAIARCVTHKRLCQFYCAPVHFEAVLECFGEAFPCNTLVLQRIDYLRIGSKISSAAIYPLVFLHFDIVDSEAIKIGRCFPSIHLFSGVHATDGRDVAVNESFERWTFDAWISATPEDSLPCLPTIL